MLTPLSFHAYNEHCSTWLSYPPKNFLLFTQFRISCFIGLYSEKQPQHWGIFAKSSELNKCFKSSYEFRWQYWWHSSGQMRRSQTLRCAWSSGPRWLENWEYLVSSFRGHGTRTIIGVNAFEYNNTAHNMVFNEICYQKAGNVATINLNGSSKGGGH